MQHWFLYLSFRHWSPHFQVCHFLNKPLRVNSLTPDRKQGEMRSCAAVVNTGKTQGITYIHFFFKRLCNFLICDAIFTATSWLMRRLSKSAVTTFLLSSWKLGAIPLSFTPSVDDESDECKRVNLRWIEWKIGVVPCTGGESSQWRKKGEQI